MTGWGQLPCFAPHHVPHKFPLRHLAKDTFIVERRAGHHHFETFGSGRTNPHRDVLFIIDKDIVR
jgi:hypothetical protein